MRKGGKRIIWVDSLTRQAKSSCKQACGCISKAVRAAPFFTRGSGIKKQPVPSRHYYFPTQAASFSFSSGTACLIGESPISWRAAVCRCGGTQTRHRPHEKQIKLAPRQLTREKSPLIDAAASRPTSRLSLARIASGGAVCQWHTIKAPTGAERRPLPAAACVQAQPAYSRPSQQ